MTADQLLAALRAMPFEAFVIRMTDGSSYRIPHPGYIAYPTEARTAAVVDERGIVHILDLRLMTELIFENTLSLQA